jgi:diacylglycerol kinase family enzyme
VRALLHGEIRRVDYAEVNGRLFLCNSIIGILPPLMEKRESLRGASDFARNAALLKLGYKIFKRSPRLHVTVNMDGTGLKCKVRGIAICNNDYHDAHSLFPHKAPLDAGKLKVYLPPNPSRRETVRILLRVLLGTWRHDRDIIAYETQEVTIETRRRRVRLVIDGEPEEMEPPLNYHIRPRALRVIVPPGDRGGTSMR